VSTINAVVVVLGILAIGVGVGVLVYRQLLREAEDELRRFAEVKRRELEVFAEQIRKN
jgi:hypothetical protein